MKGYDGFLSPLGGAFGTLFRQSTRIFFYNFKQDKEIVYFAFYTEPETKYIKT